MKKTLLISLLLGLAVVTYSATPTATSVQALPVQNLSINASRDLLVPSVVPVHQQLGRELTLPMDVVDIPSTAATVPSVPQIQVSTNTFNNVTIKNLYTGPNSRLRSIGAMSGGGTTQISGGSSASYTSAGGGGISGARRIGGLLRSSIDTYSDNGNFKPSDIDGKESGWAPPPPDGTKMQGEGTKFGPITDTPYILLLLCVALYAFIRYRRVGHCEEKSDLR